MACCYVLSRWDRRGGASVTRQAPGPDSEGCGAAVAAAVAQTVALRAHRERQSQPCSPSSPSTPEQPSLALAGPGSLPPGKGIAGRLRVGVGRCPRGFELFALEAVGFPHSRQSSWVGAMLGRSLGISPRVLGATGAGSGLPRPRDRFVYKHWRALRVRGLGKTAS